MEESTSGPAQEAELSHSESIANYRIRIGAKEHRLLRGDLHRHTELSWDEGVANNGSPDDFYRYMLVVAVFRQLPAGPALRPEGTHKVAGAPTVRGVPRRRSGPRS